MGHRQCRTAEKEIINVLEECLGPGSKVDILSQSLAKEMGAVLKTLRENSPCKVSGVPVVRFLQVEGKEEV